MSKPVSNVTAAIIYNGDKFLICQRPKEKACGLLWEFPGGKIEPGETPEDCISRECMEELNIELKNIRYFCNVECEHPDRIINLAFFKTTIKDPEQLAVKEHNDVVWVDKSELDKYNFCPTDTKMLEQFKNDL